MHAAYTACISHAGCRSPTTNPVLTPLNRPPWLPSAVLQGPTYSATINGGECEISDEDGSVECEEPFIELSSTPYTCNLPFRGQVKLEVSTQQHTTTQPHVIANHTL